MLYVNCISVELKNIRIHQNMLSNCSLLPEEVMKRFVQLHRHVTYGLTIYFRGTVFIISAFKKVLNLKEKIIQKEQHNS